MEIQEHLIKDSEIIGIGLLMREAYPDQTVLQLYKRFRWSFDIYTKQQSINIKSNWLDFDGANQDEIKKAEIARKEFKQEFDKARENISLLINQENYAKSKESTRSTS